VVPSWGRCESPGPARGMEIGQPNGPPGSRAGEPEVNPSGYRFSGATDRSGSDTDACFRLLGGFLAFGRRRGRAGLGSGQRRERAGNGQEAAKRSIPVKGEFGSDFLHLINVSGGTFRSWGYLDWPSRIRVFREIVCCLSLNDRGSVLNLDVDRACPGGAVLCLRRVTGTGPLVEMAGFVVRKRWPFCYVH
jgi:hypothetical protein